MNTDLFKKSLIEAYKSMRSYAYHVLEDLSGDEAQWQPEGVKARTIYSYARHMVNTEIYWMKALDEENFAYIPSNTPFSGIISSYKTIADKYLDLLGRATIDDLKISPTKMDKDEKVVIKGTLAWTVLRITLHAFGHISHINHIRYSMNKPADRGGKLWWESTEKIINLNEHVVQSQ